MSFVEGRSTVGEHGTELLGRSPSMHGVLFTRGFFLFQRWRHLNVELKNNVITLSVLRRGVVKRTFQLDTKTVCEDSSIRHFCFCLYKPNGECLYLATDSMAAKESWIEAIQSSLSILRLAGRKLKHDDRDRMINQYINRPILYIKVIRAQNLLGKDVNGTSDPYVKISVGASTVRTTTRKKDLNPEWGMVFSFDWDVSMRYAVIEVWDEDYSSADDFLGQVFLPLLPLRYYPEEPVAQWYPLTRRSSRGEFRGAIQLEVSCSSSLSSFTDIRVLYDFAKQVCSLDEFSLNILPSEEGLGVIPLKDKATGKLLLVAGMEEEEKKMLEDAEEPSASSPQPAGGNDLPQLLHKLLNSQAVFPVSFPSLQCEQVEDIAFNVLLVQTLSSRKISSPGVLLFTNYRLIFITHARIFTPPAAAATGGPNAEGESGNFDEDTFYPTVDLTTQVFVGQVVSVHQSTEHDSSCNTYHESLKIRTADHRHLIFVFKDDAFNINDNYYFNAYLKKINKRIISLLGTNALGGNSRKKSILDNSQKLIAAGNSVSNMIPGSSSNSIAEDTSFDDTASQRKNSLLNLGLANSLVGNSSTAGGPASSAGPMASVGSVSNLTSALGNAASLAGLNLEDDKLTGLASSWLKLLTSPSVALIEALDSVEGPPAHRIYYRLKNRCANRPVERYMSSVQHHKVLNQLREVCGLMSYPLPAYIDEKPPLPTYGDYIDEEMAEAAETANTFQPSLGAELDSPSRTFSTDKVISLNPMLPTTLTSSPSPFSNSSHQLANYTAEEPEVVSARTHSTCDTTFIQNHTPLAPNTHTSLHSPSCIPLNQGTAEGSHHSSSALAESSAKEISTPDPTATEALSPLLSSSEPALASLVSATEASPEFKAFLTKFFFNLDTCWQIYDPLVEFRRMGIPNKQWRISYLNSSYRLCPSYPNLLCVPTGVTDDDLVLAAKFRSKCRLPALSWRSPKGVTICRCSQPMVGISSNRNIYDEQLVNEIRKASVVTYSAPMSTPSPSGSFFVSNSAGSKKSISIDDPMPSIGNHSSYLSATAPPTSLVVIDARPLLNAKANQAVGKGVESDKNYTNVQVLFMDIPNIHAVRKAFDMLDDCMYNDEVNFQKNLENTLWLAYIRKILLGVMKIVYLVNKLNTPILIHCSDGWDRTSQLTSLSMLLSDPYYRTLTGFVVLIEKEWCSFGHKFADRLGYTTDNYKDEERSPVFVQFLDCVYQVLAQMPHAFEFQANLLLFIRQHLYSSCFANFLFNNEYERKFFNIECHGISIWTAVLANASVFINPQYRRQEGYLIPIVSRTKLILWQEAYFHWHDKLYLFQYQQFNDLATQGNNASTTMANINQLLYGTTNTFVANNAGNNRPVVWVEDKNASACMKCERAFTFYRRRHHCRCCGLIYCDKCCRELRLIPAISTWKLSRCCLDCASALDLALAEAEISQKKLSISYRKSMEPTQQFRHSTRQIANE